MAASAGYSISRFMDTASMKLSICIPPPPHHFSARRRPFCEMSMNGCQVGDPRAPVGTIQTRTFPVVLTPALAVDQLGSALSEMKSEPAPSDSGIIRLEVPIQQQIEAIDWLRAQKDLLPRCFFSGRKQSNFSHPFIDYTNGGLSEGLNGHTNGSISEKSIGQRLLSVAGIGSSVFFQHSDPFSLDDWRSIRRFLSEKCPLIRAYGAIRFDARANVSPEWKAFGSFYFLVPQVEFDEFEGSSMLSVTIAWDKVLSCPYSKAVAKLQYTLEQVSSTVVQFEKEVPNMFIFSSGYSPNKSSWDMCVNKALKEIKSNNSELSKVVLARRSRIVTETDFDPLSWLSRSQVDGENFYQFCLQPPNAPAFIGNTPERLFHRNSLRICSEALAATRARGGSEAIDLQIELDLLSSSKDHVEFTIVREWIKRKLEAVCASVLVEPEKAIRKLPKIQHLYAQLIGILRSEFDEFEVLSSLHPTPAVCGYPTEDARVLIAETEPFDRGMYAGPIGWFGGRESEFAVGIRSALVNPGLGALVYAGTGIVEGSDPSSEWEELDLKTAQFTKYSAALVDIKKE